MLPAPGEQGSDMSGRLDGKVAVVTGGGNGIGRACCLRFAEEGADVVVADLLDDAGQQTAKEIEAGGRRSLFVHLDASSRADNDALMDAADDLGGVDVLVTAAGISHSEYKSGDRDAELRRLNEGLAAMQEPWRTFLDLTDDAWQRVLDVNLTGTFYAVQAAARKMVAAGKAGSIVTIASIAAKVPEAGPLSYAVSKAGVWMLTKHVARGLGRANIRINAIGPGFIETNMTKIIEDLPMVRDQLMMSIPLGRVGQPEEVAEAALFLASDASSYFTGEILHPDGGFYTD